MNAKLESNITIATEPEYDTCRAAASLAAKGPAVTRTSQHREKAFRCLAPPALIRAVLLIIAVLSLCEAQPSNAALNGRIAYARYDTFTIWVFDARTQQSTLVPLPSGLRAFNARWTPDGEWIVFAGGPGGNSQVYTVRPDGSGLRMITGGSGDLVDPAVSADGSRLAYHQVYGNVYVVNYDGTGLTTLGYGIGMVDWSPDGRQLVGTDWAHGGGYNSDLWVWNLDTETRDRITSRPDGTAYVRPAWSPDGSKIAAVFVQPNGQMDIVVMNTNGTGQVNLTADWPSDEHQPAWSVDGQYLLFTSTRDGSFDVWVMRADGSGKTKLISGGGASLVSPAMASGTIPADTTPPTVICPAPLAANANSNCQARVPNLASQLLVSDDTSPVSALTITQNPAANSPVGIGVHEISVTVTDEANNSATCSTSFSVVDSTPLR